MGCRLCKLWCKA